MRQKKKTFRGSFSAIWNGRKKKDNVERLQKKLDRDLLDASEDGGISQVRRLLKKGASINARDENGNSPFALATRNGHMKTARILLEYVEEKERKISQS